MTSFLNATAIDSISEKDFLARTPYPWVAPVNFISEEGYNTLVTNLIPMSAMSKDEGKVRKYGEMPHDRYRLSYDKNSPNIPPEWHKFVKELNGPIYKKFISRMLGVSNYRLRLEWHYAEKGGAVNPHLDGKTTYGAHLFYLNTKDNWDPGWGGNTLILETNKPLSIDSNPAWSDFDIKGQSECLGNNSLLFKNSDLAWHAVKELSSPPGKMRKIFAIFISVPKPLKQRIKETIKSVLHIK